MSLPIVHPTCRRDGTDNRLGAFLRGFREAVVVERATGVSYLSSFGVTYDDDPTSPRSAAYDRGRNLRAKLAGLE